MHAVTIVDGGLDWREHPDPLPGPNRLLVSVHAAGVNAADLVQVQGFYPPPPGWPIDIPGMELAGEVVATGPGATRFRPGDRVMALVGGGAQAELAEVDETSAMVVPKTISWQEAGGFAEVFCTAHDALFTQCGLVLGDRLLVTGAAGGVGTAAVQLGAAAGAHVVASVRRQELRDAVAALGAAEVVAPDAVAAAGPFDVVLELVAGEGFASSLQALAMDGRLCVIGVGSGSRQEIDLFSIMGKRASIRGSTLRARSVSDKEKVVRPVESHVVPLLAAGRVRVPVLEHVPMSEAEAAYERFSAGGKLGKVILTRG